MRSMADATFRVSVDGLYFEVRVFPDKDAMHKHYRRSSLLNGRANSSEDATWIEDAEALCCPRREIAINDNGTETPGNRIGVILFHRELLRPMVVVHELTHAALAWWRECKGSRRAANFGQENSAREEEFAHVLSLLWQQINEGFHKRRLWGVE